MRHSTAFSYLTPQISTKTSNAASASFLVSAIQISCSSRLAFEYWLFGSLFSTLAVLCTQQRWPRGCGHTSSIACEKPRAPSATASSGATASPRRFRSSSSSFQDCALSRTPSIRPTNSFLPSGGTDDDQQALRSVLEPGLDVDAVGPEVDVTLGGEIALAPARMLLRPGLLEPSDGRGREPASVLAEQRDQCLIEVAGRDALQVEDRDQHFEALRSTRVRRQNRRRKADALGAFANTIAHARAAHGDWPDAGHDPPLGQMPGAAQPMAAVVRQLVGMTDEQGCNLALNGVRQQRSGAAAQHLGQRIGKSSWLGQLETVSLGTGVSLLRWRSGGVEHPQSAVTLRVTRRLDRLG